MRMLLLCLFVALCLGGLWGIYRTPANSPVETDLHLSTLPQAHGDEPNLVAVQPWLEQGHYQSAAHLRERLAAYLDAARDGGALTEGSIVVFPEHAGTWLVASGAPAASFGAGTTAGAMAPLLIASPLPFLGALINSDETDRVEAAIFRMRAPRMARDYQTVFGGLAEEYGVTVVAGSIVLPDPAIENGALRLRQGPLYNTTAVFNPDGTIAPALVRKTNPIPSEAGFTASWPAENLPVFETPAGRLGVLICADSWHPELYASLASGGAEIVAVPAFLQPSDIWNEAWHGYTTGWPEDVAPEAAEDVTEGEAWMTHALAGRMPDSGARFGATAFLRGNLWDLGSDGANILVTEDGAVIDGDLTGASISVLPLTR